MGNLNIAFLLPKTIKKLSDLTPTINIFTDIFKSFIQF